MIVTTMAAPIMKTMLVNGVFAGLRQTTTTSATSLTSGLLGVRQIARNEVNVPAKPKRPPSSWVAFVKDRKNDILRQKQNMTASEMAVILSKEWKSMDKSKYEQEYLKQREEYARLNEEFKSSLTDEQKEYIQIMKTMEKENKALRELRKTKPPKMPRNAANLYCLERCQHPDVKDQLKTSKSSQVFSNLFKEYRTLNDSEKEKYFRLHQDDIKRFKNEFLNWYDNIQQDTNLSEAAKEQADIMKIRFQTLNYI